VPVPAPSPSPPVIPLPNATLALVTPGSGALLRPNTVPDTNACRGPYATDLQSFRSAVTQVASGTASVLVGGEGNTASGNFSSVGGGQNNSIDVNASASVIAGGSGNAMTDTGGASSSGLVIDGGTNNSLVTVSTGPITYSTISGGTSNTISNPNPTELTGSTIAGGVSNMVTASYAGTLAGTGLILSQDYSTAVGAYNANGDIGTTPAPRLFMVGNGNYGQPPAPRNAFSVAADGNAYLMRTLTQSTTADFAESFESHNGERYPYGASVSLLSNGKIKRAEAGDIPIGVVSDNPAVLCGTYDEFWHGKYLRDDDGKWVTSPDYDPTKTYVPRSQRPEWHPIGIVGLVLVLEGEVIHPNWIRLSDRPAPKGRCWHLLR
jgi:hypothetical protein